VDVAQLKAINEATTGAITLANTTAALSGSAVDLVAALDGITGYTGDVTVTDTVDVAQLKAINNATDGNITLEVTDGALSGNAEDLLAAFAGVVTQHTGTITVTGAVTVIELNAIAAETDGIVTATISGTGTQLADLTTTGTESS
jgi:hypothetical protein